VFIPKDELGPGAIEAGVPYYIDHQLSGAFGYGARMYLQGPFANGLPQQGYQLPLNPRQIYRLGIRAVNQYCESHYSGKTFDGLPPTQQDALLRRLEQGEVHTEDVPGPIFINLLLTNTVEGFFGDPAYSGNRDMVGWKLIGFPGGYGMYADKIESYRNKPFNHAPVSLSQLQEGE
jgi:gluconate 2-dehydrogenase gamma chain